MPYARWRTLAALLAYHGMIAGGFVAAEGDVAGGRGQTLARQYHGCLQIGMPPLLPKEEIESRVCGRIAGTHGYNFRAFA